MDNRLIEILPAEMLIAVFQFLRGPPLLQAAQVCRTWKGAAYSSPNYEESLLAAVDKYCRRYCSSSWNQLLDCQHSIVPKLTNIEPWLGAETGQEICKTFKRYPAHTRTVIELHIKRERALKIFPSSSLGHYLILELVKAKWFELLGVLLEYGAVCRKRYYQIDIDRFDFQPFRSVSGYSVAEVAATFGDEKALAVLHAHVPELFGPAIMDCAAVAGLEMCRHVREVYGAEVTLLALAMFVRKRHAEGVSWARSQMARPSEAARRQLFGLCLRTTLDFVEPVLGQLTEWCPVKVLPADVPCEYGEHFREEFLQYLARAGCLADGET